LPNVTPITPNCRTSRREAELRHLAFQLAVQCPIDRQEALDTLEHAKTLVRASMSEYGAS
jgi:hypothetical protein